MERKLLTLAVHTPDKASILKQVLEKAGIEVSLEPVDASASLSGAPSGIRVRIMESDLSRALNIVEETKLFSYDNVQTYKIDDGHKRLLVPVDFSAYSLNACRIAFNIARELNAKVKILHVFHRIQYPSSLPFSDSLKETDDIDLLGKVRRKMLDLCCEIDKKISTKEFPSINYSYSIREGNVENEIINFTEEYKPLMIIIGTKGRDNKDSHVLGGITADVIELSSIPILAVPESSANRKITDAKHIAYLTNLRNGDFSPFDFLVKELNLPARFKITLLHINILNKKGAKWDSTELESMKAQFDRRYPGLNVDYKLIDSPDVVVAVNDYIRDENIDIIALHTPKRNIFARMFTSSVSSKLLFQSDISLLILKG